MQSITGTITRGTINVTSNRNGSMPSTPNKKAAHAVFFFGVILENRAAVDPIQSLSCRTWIPAWTFSRRPSLERRRRVRHWPRPRARGD